MWLGFVVWFLHDLLQLLFFNETVPWFFDSFSVYQGRQAVQDQTRVFFGKLILSKTLSVVAFPWTSNFQKCVHSSWDSLIHFQNKCKNDNCRIKLSVCLSSREYKNNNFRIKLSMWFSENLRTTILTSSCQPCLIFKHFF